MTMEAKISPHGRPLAAVDRKTPNRIMELKSWDIYGARYR